MDASVEEKPKLEPLPQRSNNNGPKNQSENGNDVKPFNQNHHNRGQNQQNRGQNQQQKRGFGGPRRNNDNNNDQRGPNMRNQRDGRNNEVSFYKMASKIIPTAAITQSNIHFILISINSILLVFLNTFSSYLQCQGNLPGSCGSFESSVK